jgi:hypothetical protein
MRHAHMVRDDAHHDGTCHQRNVHVMRDRLRPVGLACPANDPPSRSERSGQRLDGEDPVNIAASGLTGQDRPRIVWPKMPSHSNSKEIAARSPLSGHPVGLSSLFVLSLLGLLLLLLAR